MGERESKERLEEINTEIQSTQKDIDSIQQEIKRKVKEKESEKAINKQIEQALESLKLLKDQKDELDKELNKE